jgi:hypothetical protein
MTSNKEHHGQAQAGAHRDQTLQDDRNLLDLEPGDGSPLVTGEGAPLGDR